MMLPANNVVGWRMKMLMVGRIVISAAFVVLFLFVVGEYVFTQKRIREYLPSNHYSFLPELSRPPFRGASFVMDNYAGPVVAYTDQWAYYDPQFAAGEIKLTENGYEMRRDFRHLWSGDQLENPVYRKPDYFLCMRPQTPVNSVINANAKRLPYGCSRHPIAVRAMGGQDVLQHQIISRDEVKDSWMIIKLDWSFPPYLARVTRGSQWFHWTVHRSGKGKEEATFRVDYKYAQQDGVPEEGTILRIYQVKTTTSCKERGQLLEVLASTKGERQITLPQDFSGQIVISVTPATARKEGFEYFGETIRIPGINSEKVESCPYVPSPLNFLNAFAMQDGSQVRAFWSPVEFATDYLVELRENEGDWFLASPVKAPKSEFDYQVAPQSRYALRIKPCNGTVCGNYSHPIKVIH
jgi:hypothetical protein